MSATGSGSGDVQVVQNGGSGGSSGSSSMFASGGFFGGLVKKASGIFGEGHSSESEPGSIGGAAGAATWHPEKGLGLAGSGTATAKPQLSDDMFGAGGPVPGAPKQQPFEMKRQLSTGLFPPPSK